MAGDLLKQLQYGTNQAAKMSTRLIQADASKVVLEQRLAQREKEIKALHSQMSDLNVKAEETAKVSVICSIASTHPAANLLVLMQYLIELCQE